MASRLRGNLWAVGWIVLLVGPLLFIVSDNARRLGDNSQEALRQNVAARQVALLDRFGREVVLELDGKAADVDGLAERLKANADALLDGGRVEGFQGSGHESAQIRGVTDPQLRPKFEQSRMLLDKLCVLAHRLRTSSPESAERQVLLDEFRYRSAALSSNLKDAVGAMTAAAVDQNDQLVMRQILFGVLGLLAVLAVSLVFWRHATQSRDRHYRALIEQGTDLVVVADAAGLVTYACPAIERLTGASLLGRRLAEIFVHDGASETDLMALAQGDHAVRRDGQVRGQDGAVYDLEMSVTCLLSDPHVRGVVVNAHDITERKRLERELTRQAFEDELTALPNRPLLIDRLEQTVARATRTGAKLGLLFIDLDGFKMVNDSFGHAVGDDLLRVVANRLRRCVRPGDTIARLGGDEFAVLLDPAADLAEVEGVAAAIVQSLSTPCEVADRAVLAQASVGVVFADGAHISGEELLRNADVAMYAAKADGRGRYRVFESQMHDQAVRNQRLAAELRAAVDHSELHLAYQPILAAHGGPVVAVEALVRWTSPTFGPISPDVFVPLAESTGLMDRLGAWVLRNACREAVRWHGDIDGCAVALHVNVSALQLRCEGFVDEVRRVLDETGLRPELLTLELTESVFANESSIIDHLARIRELGVRVSIDDFGSGYSSLGQLQLLPIDAVKIDKSFIDRIGSPQGAAMVASIVEMAAALGLSVTAEGVETQDQLTQLERATDVHLQGFFFAKPMDALGIAGFLIRDDIPDWNEVPCLVDGRGEVCKP